ncbi:MAG: hypothetical protein EP330_21390 [Deltaproteobacteria bacterium]|nr:MAG: hypothetical protein EP330_21390 [Deltaproteobacteria bacterium]
MAEEETTETTEAETEERQPGAAPMTNPLSKPTDHVARPGFRNAPNKGSKAQRAAKKKKRR